MVFFSILFRGVLSNLVEVKAFKTGNNLHRVSIGWFAFCTNRVSKKSKSFIKYFYEYRLVIKLKLNWLILGNWIRGDIITRIYYLLTSSENVFSYGVLQNAYIVPSRLIRFPTYFLEEYPAYFCSKFEFIFELLNYETVLSTYLVYITTNLCIYD